MDLLSQAYATASGSDDDDVGKGSENWNASPPPPKRTRPETSFPNRIQMPVYRYPNPPPEVPIPGRYISKRQRAALAANPTGNDDNRACLDVSSGPI